jgi:hypothetical protein
MIDFQSLLADVAGLLPICQRSTAEIPSPGREGRGEGELNHRGRQSALIKVGRVYSRAVPLIPSVIWPEMLCSAPLWQKFVVFPNAVQSCPTPSNPVQGPPGGRVVSNLHLFAAITAYYRLLPPNDGLFPGKKDCLFLRAAWLPDSNQPKSTHTDRKAKRSKPKNYNLQSAPKSMSEK